jgi:uncharacterized protein YndB with AHSA1/START domain
LGVEREGQMLKWSLFVIVALVSLVGIMAAIGATMPKGHRAARTVLLRAAPAQVFALISDFVRAPEWRSDVTRVELLADENGKQMFRETGKQGAILYRVETREAPSRLVTRIADSALPFGGTWTFELTPKDGGTALTITEDGEVYNPIFRFMSKVFFSQTATMDAYLSALEKKLGG